MVAMEWYFSDGHTLLTEDLAVFEGSVTVDALADHALFDYEWHDPNRGENEAYYTDSWRDPQPEPNNTLGGYSIT